MRIIKLLLLTSVLLLEAFTFKQAKPVTGPTGPVFKCAATVTNNQTTGTLSCVQTGDWIIAFSCGNLGSATQTVTCPTGFTDIGTNSLSGPSIDGNHGGQKFCYRIATAADTSASTYTFVYNGTGAGFPSTAAMDFRGGTTTFDVAAVNFNTSGGQTQEELAKSVTTTKSKDMVVTAWCGYASTGPYTGTPPGSTTTAYTGNPTFNGTLYASYLLAPQPGTTAAQIISFPASATFATNTVAFGGS